MKQKDPIKLMVTIVHHGKGDTVAHQFGKGHVGTHYVCHGFGTASSEVMDYLGIGEPEKDIVFSLVPLSQAKRIMEDVREGMGLHLPGRGITFILPLTAVSKIIERTLHSNVTDEDREEEVRSLNPEEDGCEEAADNHQVHEVDKEVGPELGFLGSQAQSCLSAPA